MIAKQVKGCNFRGCLDYLLNRETAKIIGGNMKGSDPSSLEEEFKLAHQLNKRVKRYVYHASLSLKESEKISTDTWCAIAHDYLQGMGFTDNQHIIVGHNDTQHNHIHIVASRIKMNGKPVHDHWDFIKSEKLVRSLEKKYDLEVTPGSKEKLARTPTTGETRLRRRTGESSVREFLQGAIDSVCSSPITMPSLIVKLSDLGIETRITSIKETPGISFFAQGIAFSGTHLGKGYTFNGLQKYKGVEYVAQRDDELLFNRSSFGCDLQAIMSDTLPPVDGRDQEIAFYLIKYYKESIDKEKNCKKQTNLVL